MKTLRHPMILLVCLLIAVLPAHGYYGPSIGRFINRDPIEEKGGLNLYSYVLNQPVNAIDYLGMDIIFGVRVGSTVKDPGHVLVGVTAGNNVRIFDWQATGGAGAVFRGLGTTDASVDAKALSRAVNLSTYIASRSDYTFYRLSTTHVEDVLALAKAYELRDLANASEDDNFYNILLQHCGDKSCEVIQASGNLGPMNSFTPADYRWEADRLSQPGQSGWIRITPTSNPTTSQNPGPSGSTGNVYSAPSADAMELEKFTVTGSTTTGPSFEQQRNDLQLLLGRRPTQSEWWNRDFAGGAPGSMRDQLWRSTQEKTPEELIEEEIQRIRDAQER